MPLLPIFIACAGLLPNVGIPQRFWSCCFRSTVISQNVRVWKLFNWLQRISPGVETEPNNTVSQDSILILGGGSTSRSIKNSYSYTCRPGQVLNFASEGCPLGDIVFLCRLCIEDSAIAMFDGGGR